MSIARAVWSVHDYISGKEPLNRLGCYIAFGYKNMKEEWGETPEQITEAQRQEAMLRHPSSRNRR